MDNQQGSLCKYYKKGIWVCENGEVYGAKEKLLSTPTSGGYLRLTDGKSLHRLVYQMFKGKIPAKSAINHKDGNKANNAIENLECVTHKENMRHSVRVLGNTKGTDLQKALNTEQLKEVVRLLRDTDTPMRTIARQFNVSGVAISAINTGKNCTAFVEPLIGGYPIRGVHNYHTKLELSQLSAIVADLQYSSKSLQQIGRENGVSMEAVRKINLGITWKGTFNDYPIRSSSPARTKRKAAKADDIV